MSGRCNLILQSATSSAFQISKDLLNGHTFSEDPNLNKFSASYLGITVNSKLKWSERISSISSKASRSLGLHMIKRNLWNCPRKVRETAYTSIVRPKQEYASASWDPHYNKHNFNLRESPKKSCSFLPLKLQKNSKCDGHVI